MMLIICFMSLAAMGDALSTTVKGGIKSCATFFSKVLIPKKIR